MADVGAGMRNEQYRPKVLYIGGTGRTGSTLLTKLLGEVPGWFAGGELAFMWRYGLQQQGRCACGDRVADCELWSQVFAMLIANDVQVDADQMVAARKRCWSIHLPLMALPGIAARMFDRLGDFPHVVESTYRAIADVTQSRVIVDSSKEPHYSWILRDRTDLDMYFVHLVRDPRAVAYSWSRQRREKGLDGVRRMENRGPLTSSLYYTVSNVAAEAIWSRSDRYRLMRYEDFVASPERALAEIADFIGEPLTTMPVEDGRFNVSPNHIAWGNPNRFDAGTVQIHADEVWRRNGGRVARSAGFGSAAIARNYGYRPTAPESREVTRRLARHQIPSTGEDS